MDAAREVAQLAQRELRVAVCASEQLLHLGRARCRASRSAIPRSIAERDEPLLRAVVQVALEPLALLDRRVDRPWRAGR